MLKSEMGNVFDGAGQVIKTLTTSHNADEIGIVILGINNATIVKLFLMGVEILAFTKLMSNYNIGINSSN